MKIKIITSAILTTLILSLTNCNKQSFISKPSLKLIFSSDTITFDTTLAPLQSTVRILKIYNPYDFGILINKIYLAGGTNSTFKININGSASTYAQNIKIPKHDSIYIFIQKKSVPSDSQILQLDSIIFLIASSTQKVILQNINQPVNLLSKSIIYSNQTWDSTKPYLITHYLIIDSNATLNIQPGTRIYLHNNALIYCFGSLQSHGKTKHPVIFTTDRLDNDYKNIPGQWGAIILAPSAHNCSFFNTIIQSSIIGISIDSVQDTVIVANSIIQHQSYANIFACCSNLKIFGSLLDDAGWYNCGLVQGGNYTIINSTLANYYAWGTIRSTPALAATNYKIINNNPVFWLPIHINISNSIIYGNLQNELILSPAKNWQFFSYSLNYNLIKTTQNYNFNNCIINKSPQFQNITNFNFQLQANSPAINNANPELIKQYFQFLLYDMNGNNRLSDGKPDIGAFEFVK